MNDDPNRCDGARGGRRSCRSQLAACVALGFGLALVGCTREADGPGGGAGPGDAATGTAAEALHEAARTGDLDAVKRLVKQSPNEVDSLDAEGFTPLHWAVAEQHADAARFLLEHQASPNVKDASGRTALHSAAWDGTPGLVEMLLAAGADPNAEAQGNTPLHGACWQGHLEPARLLLEKGARVDARDVDGATALHKAAYRGHAPLVALLLKHGADPAAKDPNGFTALFKAQVQLKEQSRAPMPVRDRRPFGPEQATGEPDTSVSGDVPTAWSPAQKGGKAEWLTCEFPQMTVPDRIEIHTVQGTGALRRIVFWTESDREVEVWQGTDPSVPTAGHFVANIPVSTKFRTNKVRLEFDPSRTPDIVQIDAVALGDQYGSVRWANDADASSTRATGEKNLHGHAAIVRLLEAAGGKSPPPAKGEGAERDAAAKP